METILTSLVAQLKNPLQYICVGIVWFFLLYLDSNTHYIFPLILLSIGTAYILEKLFGWIKEKYKKHRYKKQILFTLSYLNNFERDFIIKCIKSNSQTVLVDALKGGIISSLKSKTIAYTSGLNDAYAVPLTIYPEVWKIIMNNKNIIFKKKRKRADAE